MNKLGFVFLRMPRTDEMDEKSIDMESVCALADAFMERGGDYFDTAYTYLEGMSEAAIREAVVRRHKRGSFRIADKLPPWCLKSEGDCERIFAEQLARCGVDYFDLYLLHGMDAENVEICEKFGVFDFLRGLKERGLAKRIGFSFHDDPSVLEYILSRHPEMEFVQLQINYLDWLSPVIRAKDCYDIAVRYGLPVMVMEPVKGGSLASLPPEAKAALDELHPDWTPADWAVRFAQSLEGVEIVLSGMNSLSQIEANMADISPLNAGELAALAKAAEIIRQNTAVGCTGCRYCTPHCPNNMDIPGYFALYNDYCRSPGEKWKMEYLYARLGQIDCLGCGECARHCPQRLDIPAHLEKVKAAFQ